MKLLADKKPEAAYQRIAETRARFTSRAGGVDRSIVLPLAQLVRGFRDAGRTAQIAGEKQLAARADAEARELVGKIMEVNETETTPRLDLASELEGAAARAVAEDAIRLLERANSVRTQVRLDDPKNSECACFIARNLEDISRTEGARGNSDAALLAMQRALQMSQDLNVLEPGKWDNSVVSRAQALSRLHANRGEHQLAVLYAGVALDVRRAAGERHSATSTERIAHAEYLALTQVG